MITAFLASLWAKCWKWIVLIGGVLLAFGAVFIKGRSSGKATESAKVADAQQQAQTAQQTTAIVESRHDTDQEVQNLPQAPAQTVASADPATAAGQLRTDGWVRPDGS